MAKEAGLRWGVRVPKDLAQAIDAMVEVLAAERPGTFVDRSSVMREAMIKGLEVLRQERRKENR